MKFDTVPTRDQFYGLAKNPSKYERGIPILNKILGELGLYHRAFSPMAQRNILTSLQQYIRAWESVQIWGGSLFIAQSMKALKEVVDRTLGPVRGYTHVRCIGWKVGSGGWDNTGGTYFSNSSDDRLDMRAKCQKMKAAINAARNQLANFTGVQKDDDNTLKVFMAPEFYFRGVNGAYPADVVSDIVGTMMKQESFTLHGTGSHLFKNWLFVFGTAVCAFEVEEGGKAEIHNVALIQKEKDTYTVAKEFVSPIDYKKNTAQQPVVDVSVTDYSRPRSRAVVNRSDVRSPGALVATTTKKALVAVAPTGSSSSGIASKHNDERMGGCIFTVDGITFGLEVCLDHAKSSGGWKGRLAQQCESIQVLLVPSWGMTIGSTEGPSDGGMYCKMGGIAFNVDGRQITGSTQPSAEVKVRDDAGDAPKTATPYTPQGIDGSIDYFGPFPIPPK